MANKIFIIIIGVGLIFIGAHFIGQPTLEDFRFGVINLGENHKYIGGILVVVGVFVLFGILKSSMKGKKKSKGQIS